MKGLIGKKVGMSQVFVEGGNMVPVTVIDITSLIVFFKKGELVDVTGITKGRGYQGVMKRWSFRGFGQTHGTHEYRKHPGAIGQRKTPGRVYPNKKLPGHYGVEQVTTQNLEVVDVLAEKNLILVKGGVAGHNDGLVVIKPAVKSAMRAAHKREEVSRLLRSGEGAGRQGDHGWMLRVLALEARGAGCAVALTSRRSTLLSTTRRSVHAAR